MTNQDEKQKENIEEIKEQEELRGDPPPSIVIHISEVFRSFTHDGEA